MHERVAQPVGQGRYRALKQQKPTSPQQRFDLGGAVLRDQRFPDSFNDRLGDGGGERAEFVVQCADEVEDIAEFDPGGDRVGGERQ